LQGILSAYQRYLSEGIEFLLPSYLELLTSLGRCVTIEGCPGTITGVTTKGELKIRLQSPGSSTEICLPPGSISLGYGRNYEL
jgi:BirA family biotin operon repressor/biotin-[acetyl-CoA-carboxylase] ligase